MKFTLSWLKEHLDTTATLTEVRDALTMLGLLNVVHVRMMARRAVKRLEGGASGPTLQRDSCPDQGWGVQRR